MTINHLPNYDLRNRFLCEDHFDDKCIVNKSGKRKRLIKTALPIHYKECLDIAAHSPQPSTSQGTYSLTGLT